MHQEVDILIAGAGLVGLALAAALANTHYRVAIIDQQTPARLPEGQLDNRIYAVSPRSRLFLTQIGAWAHISAKKTAPIWQMKIAEWGEFSALHFDAAEVNADELAVIVENQTLQMALWQQLVQAENVTFLAPCNIASLSVKPTYAEVSLHDQHSLQAKLVIGADGAHSFIRAQMGSQVKMHDYQQQAIVANYACERPHRNIAYQWFFPDGVLAWLPLPDNQISMVWSVNEARAGQLRALSAEALADKVAALGGGIMGKLTMKGASAYFPLSLMHVTKWVTERIALVGDAAHTIHPLAGQGVNLGFAEVEVLTRLLLKESKDPGKLSLLRQYERERREAVYKMQAVTHALKILFNNTHPIARPLRNFGLRCTDQVGLIKRQLIQAALS